MSGIAYSSKMELSIGLAYIVLGIFSNGVDLNNISVGDGPFSDSNGPLSHRGVGPLVPYGPEAELYALRALYEQEAGS